MADRAIKVGLCGFSMAQARYPALFPVVEIQHTFYEPPAPAVIDRWRRMVPDAFEFTIKAWQRITHLGSSPTYRRVKRPLTAEEHAGAGGFQASQVVDDAWRVTLDCARRLRATKILFQSPARFRPTPENLAAMRAFFARIERPAGMRLMFEPRGPAWPNEVARPLCDELALVHVVDPFVTPPTSTDLPADLTYFRLHGITGARHAFSAAELGALRAMVPDRGEAYVMFNNIPRVQDAQTFLRLI